MARWWIVYINLHMFLALFIAVIFGVYQRTSEHCHTFLFKELYTIILFCGALRFLFRSHTLCILHFAQKIHITQKTYSCYSHFVFLLIAPLISNKNKFKSFEQIQKFEQTHKYFFFFFSNKLQMCSLQKQFTFSSSKWGTSHFKFRVCRKRMFENNVYLNCVQLFVCFH